MVQAPEGVVYVGDTAKLQDSHRWVVTLRSWTRPELHLSLLIYRQPRPPGAISGVEKWYSIANECPHLGLPLEQGDIEDLFNDGDDRDGEDGDNHPSRGPLILCPHHEYDFDLLGGHSSTGMKACTYRLEVRENGELWMEAPGDVGDDYRVIGLRAVSERFAKSFDSTPDLSSLSLTGYPVSEPLTIVSYCRAILLAPTPALKVSLTRTLVSLFRSGSLTRLADSSTDPPHPYEPYRAPSTVVVASGKTKTLGKGGTVASRARMLHSLANIELWAIDLAVDHIARFHGWRLGDPEGKKGKKMGWEFVADFLKVAEDEAKHFSLLAERLDELGTPYGSLPVHAGLWESALQTSHSLFARLAIVALVHEARGLDTNPTQIKRCRNAGDERTAEVLEVIHADELTHVAAGHRHFTRLCAALSPPADPVALFRAQVAEHFYGAVRGPFNEDDREKAGLGKDWYEDLKGRGFVRTEEAKAKVELEA
ncbi:hypothetical protein NBRC10512v2_001548 [Rhodotorula toruloides]|uniref:RHTO0S07e07426g1_1 n=2 Tax=Rhodotorula toruloides TaxID=5286 RepID=A0A061AZV3_RHOTO|nr:Rieske [2Fe-2S] domain containing protein [Rhodotorula toruloides NP11]EMS25256.1 Rieske [2Fe-2S] domain containing protein [Rhodotorula toruloides NP11]CDR43054.1 RHTO0S07e07426g1_1 [Rhodotorula toruloides]